MAATPSIRITKEFSYRGSLQRWSNRYHFNGGTPADLAHWNTLADAVVLAEKAALGPLQTIVAATYYAAGSNVAVGSKAYTTVGTMGPGSDVLCPGDCAALIRWATTARSTKGHPVYLFSYFHGAYRLSTNADTIGPSYKAALDTYGTAWITGFSDGTITAVRAGPNGATGTSRLTEPYVTHRDFPR
jgi:hypothetical protein